MIKLKHPPIIVLAGLIWLAIGVFLLSVGLKLIVLTAKQVDAGISVTAPIFNAAPSLVGSAETASTLLIAIALFVGYFKGKFVLMKSALRVVHRIKSHPEPMSIHKVYSPKFLILIAIMISLGLLIKYLNVPGDIRGGIDVTIGAALISGSLAYFRLAAVKKHASVERPLPPE
jgi:hypothetical protein